MIRRCPSTTVVSLSSAFVLSLVWALASSFWAVLNPFALIWDLNSAQDRLDVQVRVPDVQEGLPREPAHRGAVTLSRRQDDLAPGLGGEPAVPPGHGQARGQPLDVPLERPGQGLIEVVDVEDQPPLRRGERTEIRQVRVPAQLHPQPRGGRAGQVRRHRQRRAPVERERRHQHPPVPDRHQLRHPRRRLAQQQPDRIPPPPRRELGLRLQRSHRPGVLPQSHPVRPAQLLHRPGPAGPRAAARAPDRLAVTPSAATVMATPSGPQRNETSGR